MIKEVSELKFVIIKIKNNKTHEILSSYIEVWDGMERVGMGSTMNEIETLVDDYILKQNSISF